jgi:hypothetical protein
MMKLGEKYILDVLLIIRFENAEDQVIQKQWFCYIICIFVKCSLLI